MADDQRNFRSYYYEKVGFRGVEEKKSLEILLKEQPFDVKKLSLFCLRFPVPAVYRVLVWKLVLGILPPHQCNHEFVTSVRRDQFQDLKHSLCVMRKINSDTSTAKVFWKMSLLEEGNLLFDEQKQMTTQSCKVFMLTAQCILEIVEDEMEAYWLTTKFVKHQQKWKDILYLLQDRLESLLKKEDGRLYKHLVQFSCFDSLPISVWFRSCFANILPSNSFERIWDKVIGGSCKILVFVAIAIFLTFKRPIMSMQSSEKICLYLSKIEPDSADIIVGKAIDMWQKTGALLLPTGIKADSPVIIDRPHST